MLIFLTILLIIWIGLLIYVESIQLPYTELSSYELERRNKQGDTQARLAIRRHKASNDIWSLKRVIVTLLLTIMTVWSIFAFGWVFGFVVATVFGLEYAVIAKLSFIRNSSLRFYLKVEPGVLRAVTKYPKLFKLIRSGGHDLSAKIGSRQELEYLIDTSSDILTPEEKKLIVNGLAFEDKKVHETMTPKSIINSVGKNEFLGPLVLDGLHKTGHSRLPVIDGDVDHIVGILHLRGLLALDTKKSVTAEKAMEPRVFYIREDQTLRHALTAFLKTRHHLFIVINEFRETVGILSLEDVIEALLGRKIVDEFDAHDDLRAVALRNPRANNRPQKADNV